MESEEPEIKSKQANKRDRTLLYFDYSMKWKVYEVTLTDDEESQIGKKEALKEIQINQTIDSWDRAVLNVPPLTFNYGLHKLVFRFDIETFEPSIPFFKEAFTYVNITASALQPVLLDGSPSKVSRGNQSHYT